MELIRHEYNTPNVSQVERAASVMAGTGLLVYGLKKGASGNVWAGAGLALLATAFLRRGITGFCYSYQALGIRTAADSQGENVSVPYELGIRVDDSITVNRPRNEVFHFWRNLENLAHFMEHVESVRGIEGRRSHWTVKGPGDKRMEWDAEIINEIDDELIAWRSMPGANVDNAGSVRFSDATGGRGTEIRISLQYNPPGGAIGAFVAKMFGEEPSQQIRKDLMRLKQILEAGEIPSTEGQPVGAKRTQAQSDHETEKVATASEESFPASDAPAYSH